VENTGIGHFGDLVLSILTTKKRKLEKKEVRFGHLYGSKRTFFMFFFVKA